MRTVLIHAQIARLLGIVLWMTSSYSAASELYFVDAHSQVDQHLEDLGLIIQRMDQGGVERTILSTRGKLTQRELLAFAERYPERIIPAVRLKSGAYIENSPDYYRRLRQQLGSGRFSAMAEILLYHAQKGDKAPEVSVFPDDERVRVALDGSIESGWPFVMHIEFGPLDREGRQHFMDGMRRLLAQHPEHPFILTHMGQLDAIDVQTLLDSHHNIYFTTAHTHPVIIRHSNQPWSELFEGDGLAAAWKALFLKYPERFIFALDNVWTRHWEDDYIEQITAWRRVLLELPRPVSDAVAHGNAERLWKLAPK